MYFVLGQLGYTRQESREILHKIRFFLTEMVGSLIFFGGLIFLMPLLACLL